MKTIVVTGGIATGKSTFIKYLFRDNNPSLALFDCDQTVHTILDSGQYANRLISAFGKDSVLSNKKANRDYLRKLIFNDPAAKKELEGIIHPILKQECLALKALTMQNPCKKALIIDIPLFFETGADYEHDLVCTIALTPHTQVQRLMERNGFSMDIVQGIITAQIPIMDKVNLSDVTIWNEGPLKILHQQTERFYQHFIHD